MGGENPQTLVPDAGAILSEAQVAALASSSESDSGCIMVNGGGLPDLSVLELGKEEEGGAGLEKMAIDDAGEEEGAGAGPQYFDMSQSTPVPCFQGTSVKEEDGQEEASKEEAPPGLPPAGATAGPIDYVGSLQQKEQQAVAAAAAATPSQPHQQVDYPSTPAAAEGTPDQGQHAVAAKLVDTVQKMQKQMEEMQTQKEALQQELHKVQQMQQMQQTQMQDQNDLDFVPNWDPDCKSGESESDADLEADANLQDWEKRSCECCCNRWKAKHGGYNMDRHLMAWFVGKMYHGYSAMKWTYWETHNANMPDWKRIHADQTVRMDHAAVNDMLDAMNSGFESKALFLDGSNKAAADHMSDPEHLKSGILARLYDPHESPEPSPEKFLLVGFKQCKTGLHFGCAKCGRAQKIRSRRNPSFAGRTFRSMSRTSPTRRAQTKSEELGKVGLRSVSLLFGRNERQENRGPARTKSLGIPARPKRKHHAGCRFRKRQMAPRARKKAKSLPARAGKMAKTAERLAIM